MFILKTKLLAIIFFLFAITSCTRDDDDTFIPDPTACSTINQFVNEVFLSSGNKFYNTASFNFLTSTDSLILIKQDSLLSPSDIDYIFDQNRIKGEYDLKNCLQNKELIPRHINNELNPALGVYSISLPIFSKDNEIVIIGFSYYCNGACGFGGKYLYKKVNNTWQLRIKLMEWIS
jgi:hypothetical protein